MEQEFLAVPEFLVELLARQRESKFLSVFERLPFDSSRMKSIEKSEPKLEKENVDKII